MDVSIIVGTGGTTEYAATIAAPTVADGGDITDLAPGSLAFFNDEDNALIDGTGVAASDFEDIKILRLGVGLVGGGIALSPPMDRRGVWRWEKEVYAAGVAQITDVDVTILSPTSTRDSYTVVIIDTSKPFTIPENKESFSVYGIYASDTLLADAFVTAINDSTTGSSNVTATNNGGDLRLTGDTNGAPFRVAAREGIEDDTITYDTDPVEPTGTAAQILKLEKELNVYAGHTNKVWLTDEYGTFVQQVVTADTHDMYTLKNINAYSRKDGMDAQYGRELGFIIAQVVSGTQQTLFEAVATLAFGVVAGGAESGA